MMEFTNYSIIFVFKIVLNLSIVVISTMVLICGVSSSSSASISLKDVSSKFFYNKRS